MKLFDYNKIRKLFDILNNLNRATPIGKKNIYKNPKRPNGKCQREVFVERYLNTHLKGKFIIIYQEGKYKRYIQIIKCTYYLGWSTAITVYFVDYSAPTKYQQITLKFNDIIELEGEVLVNSKQHDKFLKLIELSDISVKEFTYNLIYFNNSNLIEGEISFKAKTFYEAEGYCKEYLKDNPTHVIDFSSVKIENI